MAPSLFMGYLNWLSSDRQFSQYIYKVFLDGFVIFDGFRAQVLAVQQSAKWAEH